MCESRFYHITQKGKLAGFATVDEALAEAKNGGFVWFNYCQPKKEELSILIDLLELHRLAIEDCLDEDQIPKMEDFPKNTFIIFNAFEYTNKKLSISEIDMFIGANFLVTVSRCNSVNRHVLGGIEQMVEREIENARRGPAFLMHIIVDYVVDQKFVAIEALEDELDIQEEIMLADIASFNPAELVRLRRDLLNLRKCLFHEREILVKICRKDCPFIQDRAIYHYRDIYDHLTKFFEMAESYREVVASLMDMYLSMLNNQMTKVANETNRTVRRLTLITTIFMPLTLLAGIGGMSEWSMMTGPANWKIAYPAFLLAMVIIGFANFYVIKWIEKKK